VGWGEKMNGEFSSNIIDHITIRMRFKYAATRSYTDENQHQGLMLV